MTEEQILLIHNCLNEILNGLPESRPVKVILAHRSEIEQTFQLSETVDFAKAVSENAMLIADAIEVVIAELGDDEFQTRTGFEIVSGRGLIGELRKDNTANIVPGAF